MDIRLWVLLGLLSAAILCWLPSHFFATGKCADWIAAYGTWVNAAIVAAVGLFAIPQLATTKKSVDAEVFLKVCEKIDDPAFGRNYELCRRDRARFDGASIGPDKRLTLAGPDSPELRNAAMDVLYTLEDIGIIFQHSALNRAMIAEYVGDVALNSYRALRPVIDVYQSFDKSVFERAVELRNYCIRNGWNEDVAEMMPFTRI